VVEPIPLETDEPRDRRPVLGYAVGLAATCVAIVAYAWLGEELSSLQITVARSSWPGS
jgi:hypothetical protein